MSHSFSHSHNLSVLQYNFKKLQKPPLKHNQKSLWTKHSEVYLSTSQEELDGIKTAVKAREAVMSGDSQKRQICLRGCLFKDCHEAVM